ncbi:DUF3857 domain-containing transglutaminase family protein [Echinicola jeungdonensis]|uniref:DUF3857 domain-containing transglutaminase family protein n=2 Tax=Echinicola jeungdonensis TaxID=709343 RepID=A0ABV5J8Y4_9BACT
MQFQFPAYSQTKIERSFIYSQAELSQVVELTSNFEVILTVKKKIRVFNQDGLDHAYIGIFHDEFTSIEKFRGEITDPKTGKRIDRLKKKDLTDVSRISNMSIYEDSRISYYELKTGRFPIEVEWEYTTKTDGNVGLPIWRPAPNDHQRVSSSYFKIIYPNHLGLRYKAENIGESPKITHKVGITQLEWELKDHFVLEEPDEEDEIMIKFAPNHFSMEGYSSNMETWKGFGQWIQKLNKGKSVLPEKAKTKVAELIAGREKEVEKIRVLYQYLQDNYRYVSIQLGIGGLMPMSATEVFAMKYGDCKGLSMFMKALLQEAGIPSNYTLVKAGEDAGEVEADFSSNQFNHVILQVPLEKDTVWLECTSKTLPAGFLGDFTMGRNVLVINEEGGALQSTPKYNSTEFNQITINSQFSLLENGNAKVLQTKTMTGLAAQPYVNRYFWQDREDFEKFIYHDLGYSGAHIEKYDLKIDKMKNVPIAEFEHETFLQQFYQSTRKRIIITPKFHKVNSRDIRNHFLHWEEKLNILNLEGMEIESAAPDLSLSEELFEYERVLLFEASELKIGRTVNLHFSEETEEEDIDQVLKKIEKLDSQPIFLKK